MDCVHFCKIRNFPDSFQISLYFQATQNQHSFIMLFIRDKIDNTLCGYGNLEVADFDLYEMCEIFQMEERKIRYSPYSNVN